ncbi:MAG TPA: hypothetical protein VFE51_16040 [Verrucomicrobiae bacterium]|nr:hypothetical protein [Verrucomicrobiae bacterium]
MLKWLALILVCSALLAMSALLDSYRRPHTAAPLAATQQTKLDAPPPIPARNKVVAEANPSESNQPPELAAMLEQLRGNADPDLRDEATQKFANSVAIAAFRSTLDSLGQDSDPAINELRTRLVRRWAEENPTAAREWISEQPEGRIRRAALEQIAIADSNRDLPTAAAWAMALPNGPDELAAKVTVAYEAARTDPVQAVDLASTLPPTPQRDDLLVHAASQWSSTDFTNAVSWALQVSDPQLRDRLVSAVAVGSAKEEPVAAATLAAQDLPPGPQQDRAVVSIVQRWAETSPDETAAWVAQFPQAPLRDAATRELLIAWLGQNPDAAESWVDSLPAGGPRERGLAAYEQALESRAPASSGVSSTIAQ